jgi:hypothetical protein
VRTIGYLAIDHGPKHTLQALAAGLPGRWLAAPSDLGGVALIVCGTSDSAAGQQAEATVRRAAVDRGVPCVVVEDFPGNFTDVSGGLPGILFVECAFAATLAKGKVASGLLRAEIVPGVRYDPLRRRLADLRRAERAPRDAVLWVGQPETADCIGTLRRLLPALEAQEVAIWFRAHPRDAGYASGAYRELFDSHASFEDVTQLTQERCLERRPRLVITQFSSVAIEAGFWGIPAMHALFPDLGGARLCEKKGYSSPPWCDSGAAYMVTDDSEVGATLDRALRSDASRALAQDRFDAFFSVREEGGPRLASVLYNQGFLSGPG